MAMGSFDSRRHMAPMAEMNVVPLVDVMLVLLVIFIVTAPLLTHAVKIDLPKASSSANVTKPEHIEFGIRENGELFWNGEPVPLAALAPRFAAEAGTAPARRPQCTLRKRVAGHERRGQGRAAAHRLCQHPRAGIGQMAACRGSALASRR
jgi:biopolymer transport protein ExbD